MTLSPVFLPWTTFDHCIPGTSHKNCHFGDTLTQSFSHHNLDLVRVAQILRLSVFSCFQHINIKNELFACCLMCSTPCYVQDNQCYPLHLSVILRLWLIGACLGGIFKLNHILTQNYIYFASRIQCKCLQIHGYMPISVNGRDQDIRFIIL